ncbi:MAG: hypothetical protein FWG02_11585 [Holophagaceae bacterium]|nr:hypothetical protein [Holophagaceae bacterium]
MLLRFLFLFVIPVVLQAQYTIPVEFASAKFPKDTTVQIELQLAFSASKPTQGNSQSGFLLLGGEGPQKQTSTNTAKWTISFDDDGDPLIDGTPKSLNFNFSKPVDMPKEDNCIVVIELIGKLEYMKDGEVFSSHRINDRGKILISNTNNKEVTHDDDPYVFYLYTLENEEGQKLLKYKLLNTWQYKDMLEGKYEIREPQRVSGTFNPADIGSLLKQISK